ncbi:MAG: efflux RND transporter periplasmic adaptor subunit [Candidatus Eisenbacteria bacterium]|nr:efflux RND transporter periplasmic adaptor subunit [Candidatus Eisenbacteria bacterium]
MFQGCGGGEGREAGTPHERPAAPVVVREAVRADVPLEVKTIGTVEAYRAVSVRPRIAGEIERAVFEPGAEVRRGDLLFVVDRRPFEAALRQAEADSARDAARAASAEATAQRYADLVEKGYVTRKQYDEALADAEAWRAAVRADEAALETARLNLDFCSIRAPIGGRAGDILVHPGNLVRANDESPLVVIHQITPVYVGFSVPERRLSAIRRHADEGTLRVEASLPGETASAGEGELTFLDNAADEATGTILLKATFPNEKRTLWPGQFVDVKLTLATEKGAVLLPEEAIQTGQQGSYVFIVGPGDTAELRPVRTGARWNGGVVIEEGVRAGEKVVTEGQIRLFPGAKVAVKSEAEPAGAAVR